MGKIKLSFGRGLRYLPKYRGNSCLNCGHPLELSHRYCPNCSQLNSTKNITVRDFIEEFLGSIVDYDSRLFRTIRAMLLRPGQISLDYINGKRVSYTNPFRFLLSLAIIYFLLQQLMGNYRDLDRMGLEKSLKIESEQALNRDSIAELSDVPSRKGRNPIKLMLKEGEKDQDSLLLIDPKKSIEAISGGLLQRLFSKTTAFVKLIQEHELTQFEDVIERFNLRDNEEDRFCFESAQSVWRLIQAPGSFINLLMSRLPLVIFFFIPVFSIFPWLMFVRKKYSYTDNLVFGFHIQSLFFILLLLGLLAESLSEINFTGFAVTIFSIYLFAAMKRFYKMGTFKTIVTYLLLNAIFTILAGFVASAYLLGSAITF